MKVKYFLKRPIKRFLGLVLAIAILLLFSDKILLNLGKALYPIKYSDYVSKYCAEYNIEESFCYALINCESKFKEDAVSSADAKGLMQLTDDTFLWITEKIYGEEKDIEDIFDPEINIRCGVWYLSYLRDMFENDSLVIAAYNAGPGKVGEWLNNPDYSADGENLLAYPFKETGKHVEKVLNAQKIYLKLYDIN